MLSRNSFAALFWILGVCCYAVRHESDEIGCVKKMRF